MSDNVGQSYNEQILQSIIDGSQYVNENPYPSRIEQLLMELKEVIEQGGGATVDQTYSPTSENAQSGVAVAEALETIPSVPVDQTYNAQSANAQSGVAVAEAIASVPTPTQIMGTITLNQNYTGITSLTQYGNIVILKLQIYPELNNVTIAGPANTELATFTGINNLPRWTNKVYLDYGTGQRLVDIYVNPTNNKILLWNKGSSFVWAGDDINLALSTTFVFPV